jgi:DNA-binding XRE family transcriptional regulator
MAESGARTLREWRQSLFMEQAEFAAWLGVRVATYRGWEQGRHVPRLPQQRAIAERLGVSPSEVDFTARAAATGTNVNTYGIDIVTDTEYTPS